MQNTSKVVVCIGSNSNSTVRRAQQLAAEKSLPFRGMWNGFVFPGVWVVNVFLTSAETLASRLKKENTTVIFLDQPDSEYLSKFNRRDTIKLALQLHKNGFDVEFENNCFSPKLFNKVTHSKHFCVVPFVSMQVIESGYSPCCLIDTPLKTEEEYNHFKQMLIDDKFHLLCEICSAHERNGILSKRQTDNETWLYDKKFQTVEDIVNSPKYDYDVRLGNKCNLMCRTCSPQASNLINEQYFSLNLIRKKVDDTLPKVSHLDLSQNPRIYVAGGEPTVSPNFYELLDRLIAEGRTDTELVFNTNCAALPREFLSRIEKFTNASAEASMDGYGKLNQYIRWPVKWEAINNNIKTLQSLGIGLNFSSVLSIYNVNHFDELVSFINSEYPTAQIHIQTAFKPVGAAIVNFPNRELAITRLERIYTMQSYLTDPVFKSKIDSAIAKLRNARPVNINILKEFFRIGEILDAERGAHLKDYNPELVASWEQLKGNLT